MSGLIEYTGILIYVSEFSPSHIFFIEEYMVKQRFLFKKERILEYIFT